MNKAEKDIRKKIRLFVEEYKKGNTKNVTKEDQKLVKNPVENCDRKSVCLSYCDTKNDFVLVH